jgi:hypothetical protein
MAQCECGCGEASNREFLPGHDQKLRAALEAQVCGLLALRSLVRAAHSYAHGAADERSLLQIVRTLFVGR